MSTDILLLQVGREIEAQGGTTVPTFVDYRAQSLTAAGNLGTAFFDVARSRGDYPAMATKTDTFSYNWIARAAGRVRDHLRTRPSYAPGSRVALQLSNSPEYLVAFYGTLLADGVVVPLPVSLEDHRRRQILESCQPDMLITRLSDLNSQETQFPTATLSLSKGEDEGISYSPPLRQAQDLAMLLFTSGSMGMPKGVMVSHRNLLANADSILRELPIRATDRALAVLPFCHAFGNSILQTHVLSGATLLIDRALTFPSSMVETLRELEATSFSAVPEVYGMLLKYGRLGETPLPALRYMTVAGGALRYDLAAQMESRIRPASFYVMYGQSEATARLASLPPQELHARPGSIGRPIPGVELAVMDDANRELPAGSTGMLCARGANVMLGYWQDKTATAEVLVGDGWLRTGDLARRDEDGFFYLQGRANLLVKVQGHRVHPAEIEGLVEADFPQTCAVAVPMTRGDEIRFVLFLAPRDDRPIDVTKIQATCQRELPSYKQPLYYEVLERFPLTSGFKIDREALARLASGVGRPRRVQTDNVVTQSQ